MLDYLDCIIGGLESNLCRHLQFRVCCTVVRYLDAWVLRECSYREVLLLSCAQMYYFAKC